MKEKLRVHVRHVAHSHGFHIGHGLAHICYLVFAVIEGHGIYAYAAGGVLVFSIVSLISDGKA